MASNEITISNSGNRAYGSVSRERIALYAFLVWATFFSAQEAGSASAVEGGALQVEPQDEVVAFAMRERGGRVMVERGKAGDKLRILDADNKVLLERSANRSDVQISAGGRHCLLKSRKVDGAEIEVLDADGKTTWRKSFPDQSSVFRVSDAGRILRTPSVEGGSFSLFDANGNETMIDATGPSQPYEFAWSPDGKSSLIALDRGAIIMCFGPDAKQVYKLSLSYKINLVAWGRAAVWDDCSAVIATYPNSSSDAAEMIRINSKGEIAKRIPIDRELLIGSPAAISPDGSAFAFVERGETLKIVRREDFGELRSIPLPRKERIRRIVFGRDRDEVAIFGAPIRPILRAGDPRVKDAGKAEEFVMRVVRRGELSPNATHLTLERAASIQFRPRFDLRSGALMFNEGRAIRRRDVSE